MSILTRYILRNFLESFFLGFIIFNFIIVLTSQLYQVVKWLVEGTYSVIEVLKYLIFISPMYLNYVIPVSIVFGIVGSISKLSSNFEITAMNSFGIDTMYIFRRIFLVVLLISVVYFFFSEMWGYRLVSQALDMYYSSLKEFRGTVKDFSYISEDLEQTRFIFAKEYHVDLGLMKDVLVVIKYKKGKNISMSIFADWAKRRRDNVWLLYSVVLYDYSSRSMLKVNSIEYLFTFEKLSSKRKRHREETNIWELFKLASYYKESKFYDLAFETYVKLNLKLIFPFSGIFLTFLVFPFSLSKVRVSNFLGIILAIGVSIGYYVFITLAQVIAIKSGIVLFLWLPNFVSIFLGGFLMFLKNKNYV